MGIEILILDFDSNQNIYCIQVKNAGHLVKIKCCTLFNQSINFNDSKKNLIVSLFFM